MISFSTYFFLVALLCTHIILPAHTPSPDKSESNPPINSTIHEPESTEINKKNLEIYCSKAKKAYQEKKFTQAIIDFQKALEYDPDNTDLLFDLARSYKAIYSNSAAINCYLKITELDQNYPNVNLNLGMNYYFKQDYKAATRYLHKSLETDPLNENAYIYLGRIEAKNKKYEQAVQLFTKAITLNPHNFDAYHYTGRTLQKMNKIEQALEQFKKARAINPTHIKNLLKIGNMYNMLNKADDAINTYMSVLEINPTICSAMYNIGYTLKRQGHLQQAINIYKKLLELKPDYALAHFSIATAYLTLGDFQNGLPEYEWRWKTSNEVPKQFIEPVWNGSDPTGKTILIYAEQGLGDTLQFIRYAQLIQQRGGTVIVEAQKPLVDLLKLCPYIDQVVTQSDPLPPFDFHIALMSLPLICKTTLETIPNTVPFLHADKTLVKNWRKKLAHDKNFKIGICWHGNGRYARQPLQLAVEAKSIALAQFAPLAKIEGVSLYSLQKMDALEEIKIIEPLFTLNTFDETFDNKNGRFMDSAAVMNNLDLVISVDTAVAHLAGGLGIPTWILLPKPADWRWLTNRTNTPWYPTMRLFQQSDIGDWSPVITSITNEVRAIIKTKKHTT